MKPTHVYVGVTCDVCQGRRFRSVGPGGQMVRCYACEGRGFIQRAMLLADFAKLFTWTTEINGGHCVVDDGAGNLVLQEKPMTSRNIIMVAPNEGGEK